MSAVIAVSLSESVAVLAAVTGKEVAVLAFFELDLVVAEAVVIGVVVMGAVELVLVSVATELEVLGTEVKDLVVDLVVVVTCEP